MCGKGFEKYCGALSQNEASLSILVSLVRLYIVVKYHSMLEPVKKTVTGHFSTGILIPIPDTIYVRRFGKTHTFHIAYSL